MVSPSTYSIGRWLLIGALVTSAALAQAQAPLIMTVTPRSNAPAAARTEPLHVTFTQSLTAASPSALQLFSSQRGGRRTQLTPASGHAATLTFTPSAYAFQPGETVNYTITTAAASPTASLGRPLVGQFTAAVSCTGTGAFQPGSLVTTGRYAEGMALGDIDNDGDLDLLVAHFSAISNTVSVHPNDGTGKFGTGQSVVVGNAPKRVVLGDVDGDGDLDLLTANQGSRTVSVRFNTGTGQFSGGSELAVDYYPTRVALGDLDGDGDLDVMVSTVAGLLNVRLNEGTGSFRPGQSVRAGSNTTDLVLGDVDGDGDLDALAVNLSSDTFSVRLNDGAGTFSGTLDVPTGAQPQTLVAGDADGDGDLDVVVTSGSTSTARVHLNTGMGTFQLGQRVPVGIGPYNAALGDVDGDGDLDLLTANIYSQVSLTFNQGPGSFATDGPPYIPADFTNTRDLVLGDVDGDWDLDLVTSGEQGGNQEVGIRLNTGTGVASSSPVQLSGPRVLCAGQRGELLATSALPPQAYRWSTGETTSRITIYQPGRYTVTATFTGCSTTSAEYVVAEGDCVAPLAVLPNIITPNGDQLNDAFTLVGLPPGPWALVLYNRWGREVYRTDAYQNEWGPTATAGLYYYHLQHPASGTSQRGWLQVVK